MGGIQSSIGVITGIPIQDTIDQLIAISATPRDRLVERNALLKQQQVAVSELTALVIGVQLSTDNLGRADIFSAVDVRSSNEQLVSTTTTGTPNKGSFSFQPVRRAQVHQSLSGRFGSDSDPLGAGNFTLRTGGFVNDTVDLDSLNGGAGVDRGKLRITDRSGSSAVIDLSYAESVQDVLDAINNNTTLNVTASTQGDQIQLTDNTGQSSSNLIVQQVGTDTTAQDLGLANIDTNSDSAVGYDILSLSDSTQLSSLNDGLGVDFNEALPELQVTFRDGSAALDIDFNSETTLGDVVTTINAADPTRLQAQISSDGDRLELIDLTADSGGTFTVSNLNNSTTLEDLGLSGTAVGDTLTGTRLVGGLGTVLINSLGGGDGFGGLGLIDVQDRSGNADSIDLTGAETLDEVIQRFNASTAQVRARVNNDGSGIVVEDLSGGAGNLVIGNGADALSSADKLGLTVDEATDSIDSGFLGKQTVSNQTRLEDYNQGRGVDTSSFLLTDSAGNIGAINLATDGLETVGDVIDAINGLGIGVEATFNQTGDGIQLRDTAGGTGTLTVEESGNGTAASDLGLLGEATLVDLGSGPEQVIDGAQTASIEITDEDSLDDLIEKINSADIGVSASKFFDGVGFRLSLSSEQSGRAGRFQVEGLPGGVSFTTVAEGKDALISVGSNESGALGILATSSTNTFDQVIEGVSFTIEEASQEVVTISIEETDAEVLSNLRLFVEQYNSLRDKLDELTSFETNGSDTDPSVRTGLLFGTTEVLRIEQALGELVSGRLFGAGDIRSLAEVGIDVRDDGKIELDEEKAKAAYSSNPLSVEQFFTAETFGVSAKFNAAIELLAGDGNSLLLTRNTTLQSRIDFNDERIAKLSESLERERNQLLKEFVTLESSIQRLQANQTALDSIQPLPPLVSVN